MNIETRLRVLEQSESRQDGVLVMIVSEVGETPEQTTAIEAARAEGRAVLLLSGSDIAG